MKKQDLKTGMLIQYRNGEFRRVFISNDDYDNNKSGLASLDGSLNISSLNDDLTVDCDHDLDIMKVYRPHCLLAFTYADDSYHMLVWERKELNPKLEKYNDLALVAELNARGWTLEK